jgi:hypothetical protein
MHMSKLDKPKRKSFLNIISFDNYAFDKVQVKPIKAQLLKVPHSTVVK